MGRRICASHAKSFAVVCDRRAQRRLVPQNPARQRAGRGKVIKVFARAMASEEAALPILVLVHRKVLIACRTEMRRLGGGGAGGGGGGGTFPYRACMPTAQSMRFRVSRHFFPMVAVVTF